MQSKALNRIARRIGQISRHGKASPAELRRIASMLRGINRGIVSDEADSLMASLIRLDSAARKLPIRYEQSRETIPLNHSLANGAIRFRYL